MLRNNPTRITLGLLAAGLVSLPALLRAQPTAHYVPGVEGIKAATLPPPGIYLRDYNVGYYADRLNLPDGHENTAVDPKAVIYANVPRLIWITDAQVLGGNLGVDALLPLQYTDLDIKVNNGPTIIDNSTFGIGDLFFEGTWSKHIPQFDFALGYGIWAPTGDSSGHPPQVPNTRAGLGYWTHMFTAGATWYPDKNKAWAFSALNRYEINQEKYGTEITPGQAYTVEGGLSYTVTKTFEVGAVGYYQQKVTTDRGAGSTNQRDRVAGIGPEVGVAFPNIMTSVSLRYAYEFLAESRLQGHTAVLTLTKRF
jgi:hypothetical protein